MDPELLTVKVFYVHLGIKVHIILRSCHDSFLSRPLNAALPLMPLINSPELQKPRRRIYVAQLS